MQVTEPPKLFGTRRRTQTLELIHLLQETHASELARLLETPLKTVQRILASLEDEQLIVGRTVGRERRIRLNERYFAASELKALLSSLARRDKETEAAAESLRRRPRKPGKEI
ncbi:MAG: winged helix-turn-helix domain-containing protein [Fimbriimonadaceae bacterium]|nr:winged helix-turn-helix domain-containing protein [Fimbriimonadaceae bacterium]MCZ7580865.1 winged helix-turn-helix domain-containing protein [Fimbriimonadaceae bacterium]QOJ12486.1 MAG: winged helix-turn-helix transcriptional regulator [Chthonomonadaceae bacterium]